MKNLLGFGGGLIAAATLATVAIAQSPAIDGKKAKALFEGHECAGCHQMEMKLVGPGLKQVADKYRGDKGAETRLLEKVKMGGVGVWGQIPMPPNAGIADEELKIVIVWILSL